MIPYHIPYCFCDNNCLQAHEYLDVLERHGPDALGAYEAEPLTWPEVRALTGPGTVGLPLEYDASSSQRLYGEGTAAAAAADSTAGISLLGGNSAAASVSPGDDNNSSQPWPLRLTAAQQQTRGLLAAASKGLLQRLNQSSSPECAEPAPPVCLNPPLPPGGEVSGGSTLDKLPQSTTKSEADGGAALLPSRAVTTISLQQTSSMDNTWAAAPKSLTELIQAVRPLVMANQQSSEQKFAAGGDGNARCCQRGMASGGAAAAGVMKRCEVVLFVSQLAAEASASASSADVSTPTVANSDNNHVYDVTMCGGDGGSSSVNAAGLRRSISLSEGIAELATAAADAAAVECVDVGGFESPLAVGTAQCEAAGRNGRGGSSSSGKRNKAPAAATFADDYDHIDEDMDFT